MDSHKNARSHAWSRALLVERIDQGWSVKAAARAIGMSCRRVREFVRRSRNGETLADRSSRPHRMRSIGVGDRQRIIELRHDRLTCRQIASRIGVSTATTARVLRAAGLSRLKSLDTPAPPVIRYERATPGELLHIDVKKLGRIVGIGPRITGIPRSSVRAGWEFAYVCIDDHSRASYVQLFAHDNKENAVKFLQSAVMWFRRHGVTAKGVMTDNGSPFRSKLFDSACEQLRLAHLRTRPYTPRTNGKAERFIQTLLREWAYRFAYQSSAERHRWLAPYLHFYNQHRRHSSLGHQAPFHRLMRNNVLRHDN